MAKVELVYLSKVLWDIFYKHFYANRDTMTCQQVRVMAEEEFRKYVEGLEYNPHHENLEIDMFNLKVYRGV